MYNCALLRLNDTKDLAMVDVKQEEVVMGVTSEWGEGVGDRGDRGDRE